MNHSAIQKRLFALADAKYKAFNAKLMPTVDPDTVIGVRTPALRKLAKELKNSAEAAAFLQTLPHAYFEENQLHAFLLEQIRDYDSCIAALDAFLPYVDNWATCDCMSPKVLGAHLPELETKIWGWIASTHPYTVRYGIGMLQRYFLDDAFAPKYPDAVAKIHTEDYYIRMMQAWYFATALAKQYDAVLPYLTEQRLDLWTHNKAIQKAIESYRITAEQKAYLRTLKRK